MLSELNGGDAAEDLDEIDFDNLEALITAEKV
jgi:hypothetical protein